MCRDAAASRDTFPLLAWWLIGRFALKSHQQEKRVSQFDSITAGLKQDGEVRLMGFGTFAAAKRAASTGRNPRTGEEIQIPASTAVRFKMGKGLKDAVN
ncbi:MAG: HU family DNA-binding protein [Acetobacteraceae bacterium]|nr:HU family DNA-binding protein [Acetobacteraceae bacterium]